MKKIFNILVSAFLLGTIPASIIVTANVKQAIFIEIATPDSRSNILIP